MILRCDIDREGWVELCSSGIMRYREYNQGYEVYCYIVDEISLDESLRKFWALKVHDAWCGFAGPR